MNLNTPSLRRRCAGLLSAALGLLLSGCGPDTGNSGSGSNSTTYTVDVTVSGLAGTDLVLQNNGRDDHAVSANGTFSFSKALQSGEAYNVTIKTQPGPHMVCTVSGGAGTVASGAVHVSVNCPPLGVPLGGEVSGLSGAGLVLQNNAADDLEVISNGSVSFGAWLNYGAAYHVTVKTQPTNPAQLCSVTGATGTMASSAPAFAVHCVDVGSGHAVSVTVSGLSGSGLVLQDNGGDALAVTANGNFSFATPLATGAPYAVTVKTQPVSPAQTCTVAGGSGTMANGPVNLAVSCVNDTVDNRPLQLSLTQMTSAAMGVLAPYVVTEAQGIALSSVTWTFDGQPATGSTRLNNNAGLALQVWNTPGTHTVGALATASNGRTAAVSMSVLAVSQPLAGGMFHSCALTASRSAKCWGDGNSGELGNNSTLGATVPVDVSGLSGLLGLAAGDGHSCALKADRTVACWGDNSEGQLGNASTFHGSVNPLQKPVDGLGNVVALAAGRYHSCAHKTDGTVACFGRNTSNELGTGTALSQSVAPVTVAGLGNVVAISAGGGYFSCALKADATVACWGDNGSGQLGNNLPSLSQTGTPQTVKTEQGATLSRVLALRAGLAHACAIVDDGNFSVYCWGNNANNQVSSVAGKHYGAIKVPELSDVLMLSATTYSSCALDLSFAFKCWGMNALGEAGGNGGTQVLAHPTPMLGLQGDSSPDYTAGGNEFLCALKGDGSAACVGRGGNGQLGNGQSQDATSLRSVSAPAGTFWRWLGAAL